MTEVIEGTAVEIVPEVRAVAVVQQPGQSLVAHSDSPDAPVRMVAMASHLASALKDIVERQKLYAVIQGKKYPQVEAWMTIARLDNVVAREAQPPIRHDDGSYEAFAELIRLSDGMVIGASSALCGTPDDKPWASRPEPARRSMAQTRAASRAFRAQYSWIMALAGYEPTPAEEMPHTPTPGSPPPASSVPAAGPPPGSGGTPGRWAGAVDTGNAPVDGKLRQGEDGRSIFGFRVTTDIDGREKAVQVVAQGPLADALLIACADGLPEQAIVTGELVMVPWTKKENGVERDMPPLRRIIAEHIATPEWTLPAVGVPAPIDDGKVDDLDALPW